MTTNHDKQKALQAHWDAEAAFINKILYVIRAIFGNLANIADIVNRYAGITGMLAMGFQFLSMFPTICLGPIAYMFNLIVTLTSDKISVANKLITFFTSSGSTGTNIASLFLHSIAIPLIVVSVSLAFVKESWGLGELIYRRYAKNETVSRQEWFDAIQGVVLASISVIAASLLFFPPAIPFAYGLFAIVGVYRFLDSINKNPLKMLFNIYENKDVVTPAVEGSTLALNNVLTPAFEPTSTANALNVNATVDEILMTGVKKVKAKGYTLNTLFHAEKIDIDADAPQAKSSTPAPVKAL